MKRLLAVGVLMFCVGCGLIPTPTTKPTFKGYSYQPQGEQVITMGKSRVIIAVLLPLTGKSSHLSEGIVNAIYLAYNNAPTKSIIVRFYDTYHEDHYDAGAAAQEAVEEGADIILGPLFSSNVVPVYQVASKKQIPVLSFSNDRSVLQGTSNLYLMGLSPEIEVERMVDYIQKAKNAQRFVAMVPDNLYGNVILSTLNAVLKAKNLTLVRFVRYPEGTIYFSPYVQQLVNPDDFAQYQQNIEQYNQEHDIKSRKSLINKKDYPVLNIDFDTLLIADTANNVVLSGVHLPYVGINTDNINLIGTRLWSKGRAKMSGENVFNSALYPDYPSLEQSLFYTKFNSIFKSKANLFDAIAYDTMQLICSLVSYNTNNNAVSYDFSRAALTCHNMNGVLGMFTLRPDGITVRVLNIIRVGDQLSQSEIVDNGWANDYMTIPNYKDIPLTISPEDISQASASSLVDENQTIKNPPPPSTNGPESSLSNSEVTTNTSAAANDNQTAVNQTSSSTTLFGNSSSNPKFATDISSNENNNQTAGNQTINSTNSTSVNKSSLPNPETNTNILPSTSNNQTDANQTSSSTALPEASSLNSEVAKDRLSNVSDNKADDNQNKPS